MHKQVQPMNRVGELWWFQSAHTHTAFCVHTPGCKAKQEQHYGKRSGYGRAGRSLPSAQEKRLHMVRFNGNARVNRCVWQPTFYHCWAISIRLHCRPELSANSTEGPANPCPLEANEFTQKSPPPFQKKQLFRTGISNFRAFERLISRFSVPASPWSDTPTSGPQLLRRVTLNTDIQGCGGQRGANVADKKLGCTEIGMARIVFQERLR